MNRILDFYKKAMEKVDLPFLIFLFTISSNKIYLKVVALVLIFVLRPVFNFKRLKEISPFYPLLAGLSVLQLVLLPPYDFTLPHLLVVLVGIIYWVICYLYLWQSYLFVKENNFTKIIQTLQIFVFINFFFCIGDYLNVAYKCHSIFPFFSQDERFGASTGDYLAGVFGRPSYINALINSLFALFFLHYRRYAWFIFSVFTGLMSFANIFNLLFVGLLFICLFLMKETKQRVFILIAVLQCLIMYMIISPENYRYVKKTIGLSVGNEKEIMPQVVSNEGNKVTEKHPLSVNYRNDSSAAYEVISMLDRDEMFGKTFEEYKTYDSVDIAKSPGKKIAVKQTLKMFADKPLHLFFGAGIGNFSSRLAFQFSGRDSSRLFMKMPKYASGYYFKNNLLIYDSMRQLPTEYHSIKHFPNNFFSQLMGEYGLAGLAIFMICYIYYYFKRSVNRVLFVILMLYAGSFLMLDYFFEFFNVMVVFETLLLVNSYNMQEEKKV